MPYLCEPEVSEQKRAIFLFFPSREDKSRLKVLNLRFSAKNQVNFRGFYLLNHKPLKINQHNMLHHQFQKIILDKILFYISQKREYKEIIILESTTYIFPTACQFNDYISRSSENKYLIK